MAAARAQPGATQWQARRGRGKGFNKGGKNGPGSVAQGPSDALKVPSGGRAPSFLPWTVSAARRGAQEGSSPRAAGRRPAESTGPPSPLATTCPRPGWAPSPWGPRLCLGTGKDQITQKAGSCGHFCDLLCSLRAGTSPQSPVPGARLPGPGRGGAGGLGGQFQIQGPAGATGERALGVPRAPAQAPGAPGRQLGQGCSLRGLGAAAGAEQRAWQGRGQIRGHRSPAGFPRRPAGQVWPRGQRAVGGWGKPGVWPRPEGQERRAITLQWPERG